MNTQNTKARKTDRILVLKVKEGAKAKDSTGLVDPRLFKGGNKLHAVMDDQSLMWTFKYEQGGLPEPLKQSFTNFGRALDHAKQYLATRGIEIEEVID